jgi:hypothetical protein
MVPLALVFLCAVPGCGPREELGHVTGQVLFQGKPVTTGTITFEDSKRGIGVISPLGPDGRYEMRTHKRPGLLPGVYRVCFSRYGLSKGDLLVGSPQQTATVASQFPPLPDKYFNIEKSGLKVEVVKGENVFDFKL